MTLKPKLKPSQRLTEFPDEGFAVLDGNLYCNNCDCHVSWIHKSDVTKHIQTGKHCKAKKRMLADESNTDMSSTQGVGHGKKSRSNVSVPLAMWCQLARKRGVNRRLDNNFCCG